MYVSCENRCGNKVLIATYCTIDIEFFGPPNLNTVLRKLIDLSSNNATQLEYNIDFISLSERRLLDRDLM